MRQQEISDMEIAAEIAALEQIKDKILAAAEYDAAHALNVYRDALRDIALKRLGEQILQDSTAGETA